LHEEIISVLSDLDMYMMFYRHPIILQIPFNGHLESAAYFTDLEERSDDVMLTIEMRRCLLIRYRHIAAIDSLFFGVKLQ